MASTTIRKRLLRHALAKKDATGISVANRFASFSVVGASRAVPRTRRNREVIEGTKRQLVYTSEVVRPMVIHSKRRKDEGDDDQRDKEIPKNAIMVFDCVMTTSAKDRDGDVLDPEGAKLDKKMPLLWQHLPFEPIGVLVKVISQDKDGIKARFAVLDTKLGRDAAKMVEAGAVRISHGFVPKEIEPIYDEDHEGDGQPPITGFNIAKYDVMECSLVSIPANPEAEILQHERVKFHHPLVKSFISSINGRSFSGRGDRSMSKEKTAEKAAPVNVHVNLGGLADLLATKGDSDDKDDEKDDEKKAKPSKTSKKDDGDDADIDKLYDIIGRAMDEDDPDKKDELLEEAQSMCRSIKDSMSEDDKDEDEDEDKGKSKKDGDDEDDEEKSTKDGDEDDDEDEKSRKDADEDDEDDEDDDDSSIEEDSSVEEDSKEQAAGEDDVEPGDSDGRADEDDDEDEKRHKPRKKKSRRNVLDDIFDDEFNRHRPKNRR